MNITTRQLLRIMPGAQDNVERNKNWLSASGMPLDILTATELLNKYAAECGITTKLHWVHFLANIAVESAELRHSEENLNYSAAGLRATWPRRFTEQEATLYAHNAKLQKTFQLWKTNKRKKRRDARPNIRTSLVATFIFNLSSYPCFGLFKYLLLSCIVLCKMK